MTAPPPTHAFIHADLLCNWVTILKDMSLLQLHVPDHWGGGGDNMDRETKKI